MNPDPTQLTWESANTIANDKDADILFLNGPIEDPVDRIVIDICKTRRRRGRVILILVTSGGDAHVAYRISRCLQSSYESFTVFVTGQCKSAGTIISLGANSIIMSDHGELGPIDAQIKKEDELFQTRSGLTVLDALSTLRQEAYEAYEYFFLQTKIRSQGDITTRTANQTAATLTGELFGRVYEHIDPMHVGEAGRFLKIAHQYGQILQYVGGNCKDDTLVTLTNKYPSHGFIIDRLQAEHLFNIVEDPSPEETQLALELGQDAIYPRAKNPLLAFLNKEVELHLEENHDPTAQYPPEASGPTANDRGGETGNPDPNGQSALKDQTEGVN